MPTITEWMSGVGTVIAAIAALVAARAAVLAARYTKQAVSEAAKSANAAAEQVKLQRETAETSERYTKQAVEEAAKSAKAAVEQVELQRPRPIVIGTFRRSFAENKGNMAIDDEALQLENIGASPAFDVRVSNIETPGVLPELDGPSRLTTAMFSHLSPSASEKCTHWLEPPRGGLSHRLGTPAAMFVQDLIRFFDKPGMDACNKVNFSITYRALDGREFEQTFAFVVAFPQHRAWVESVGSLFGKQQQGVNI